ncbi:hypothetical protein ABZ714_26570 [Streptomyces sp. NPDC006798]|uniref:hypothetical protein n=1 Tax=Streptomyces sp. NPDC006798 TaxID=3155462 RepID=UPI0033F0CF1E
MMLRTIPLRRPLDGTGLPVPQTLPAPAEQPVPLPAADIARYYHPLFLRAEPGRDEGWVTYYFGGFTGHEPRPETPNAVWDDPSVTREQRRELEAQYDSARILWSKARLRLRAAPLLRAAAPLWEAWRQAQAEYHQVFTAFWTTPDAMWRAQLLKLTDAERAAMDTARAWDEIAGELAGLAAEQLRAAGEEDELPLTDVAREIGLDADGWTIACADEYARGSSYSWHRQTPLVRALTTEIAAKRERLAEVARLADSPDTAQQPVRPF